MNNRLDYDEAVTITINPLFLSLPELVESFRSESFGNCFRLLGVFVAMNSWIHLENLCKRPHNKYLTCLFLGQLQTESRMQVANTHETRSIHSFFSNLSIQMERTFAFNQSADCYMMWRHHLWTVTQ